MVFTLFMLYYIIINIKYHVRAYCQTLTIANAKANSESNTLPPRKLQCVWVDTSQLHTCIVCINYDFSWFIPPREYSSYLSTQFQWIIASVYGQSKQQQQQQQLLVIAFEEFMAFFFVHKNEKLFCHAHNFILNRSKWELWMKQFIVSYWRTTH